MSSDGQIEEQDFYKALLHFIEHGENDQAVEKLTTLKSRATQIAMLRQLALRVARAHARDLTLAIVYSLVRNLDADLAIAEGRALDFERANELAKDLVRALDFEHANEPANDLTQAVNTARVIAVILHLHAQ
jgi:hypothetical protein